MALKKIISTMLTAVYCTIILTTGFAMTTSAYETKVIESTVQTQVSKSNGDAVYGDFTYSISDKKVKITKYTGSSETVVIPSKINEMPVTEIAFNTFADNHNIRCVTISEGVEQIWHYAFKNCVNLEKVELPNSLINIQQSAFLNCSRLKNIDIPDNVSFIGIGAFADCKSLEKIEIPDGVNDIMMATFSGCESLKRVTLSDSVKNIMEEAFKNCTALTDINIPNSVEKILSYAFQNCKTLESIVIPENVVHIGRTPFDGCTALRDIYYIGTEIQWNNILLGYEPNFEGITVHYNYKENSVCFDKSELILGVGQTDTLSVKGKVSEILTWKSSNATVATVDTNGKIIAQNIGTADITVTTTYGEQAFCKITVKQAPTKVTLNKSALIVGKGETFNFVDSVPNGQYQGTVTYTSSNRNVATVDGNGKMTAKAKGTAILTVTTYNGKTAKCRVTVKNAPKSISVNRKNSIMGLGETFYLEGSLANDEASRVLTFSSNKPEVATVTDSGIVTAKSIGTAIVSITTYNGQKATCRVTIRNAPTSLQFNKTSVTLKQGETFYLESQFNSGEYARTVIYNSPNKAVATISGSGVIMAKSKGTVKITGKTYNGKTQTCTVTVK